VTDTYPPGGCPARLSKSQVGCTPATPCVLDSHDSGFSEAARCGSCRNGCISAVSHSGRTSKQASRCEYLPPATCPDTGNGMLSTVCAQSWARWGSSPPQDSRRAKARRATKLNLFVGGVLSVLVAGGVPRPLEGGNHARARKSPPPIVMGLRRSARQPST
jgi:hypothetical protein